MAHLINNFINTNTSNPEFWKYSNFDFFKNTDWKFPSLGDLVEVTINGQTVSKTNIPGLQAEWTAIGAAGASSSCPYTSNMFFDISHHFEKNELNLHISKTVSDLIQIELNFKSTPENALFNFPICINISAGAAASVVIKNTVNNSLKSCVNVTGTVNLEHNSSLNFYKWTNLIHDQSMVDQWSFAVAKSSVLNFFDASLKSKWTRHNTIIRLKDILAETNINAAYFNSNDGFSDHHIRVEHLAPETVSNIYYKGVLSDKSRSVFNGQVEIFSKSQKSVSSMLNKNLLLSDKAEIFTKPDLKISADDVKASHGATVGDLQQDELFYLMSRGLTETQSKKLLQTAFLKELVDKIQNQSVKNLFQKDLNSLLESSHV